MTEPLFDLDGPGGVVVAPMNLSPSTDPPSPGGPPPSTRIEFFAGILGGSIIKDRTATASEKAILLDVAENALLVAQARLQAEGGS